MGRPHPDAVGHLLVHRRVGHVRQSKVNRGQGQFRARAPPGRRHDLERGSGRRRAVADQRRRHHLRAAVRPEYRTPVGRARPLVRLGYLT